MNKIRRPDDKKAEPANELPANLDNNKGEFDMCFRFSCNKLSSDDGRAGALILLF